MATHISFPLLLIVFLVMATHVMATHISFPLLLGVFLVMATHISFLSLARSLPCNGYTHHISSLARSLPCNGYTHLISLSC